MTGGAFPGRSGRPHWITPGPRTATNIPPGASGEACGISRADWNKKVPQRSEERLDFFPIQQQIKHAVRDLSHCTDCENERQMNVEPSPRSIVSWQSEYQRASLRSNDRYGGSQ